MNAGTGRGIAGGALGAVTAFEHTEAGDRHSLAPCDGGVHAVDDGIERGRRALSVDVEPLGERIDELSLVGHVSSPDVLLDPDGRFGRQR